MRNLENLRARSAYPTFRTFCSILWIVAIISFGISAFISLFAGLFGVIGLLGSALGLFLVKVGIEASMMLADIADCTLDTWQRGSSEAAPPPAVTQPEAKVPIELAERSF